LSSSNISSALPWSAVTISAPPSARSPARAARAQVDGLDREHRRVEDARVPDHVAVGVVDARVAVACPCAARRSRVGDLGGLHPRPLLEGQRVARDLDVRLEPLVEGWLRLPFQKYVT
jgi:hypothetical protein